MLLDWRKLRPLFCPATSRGFDNFYGAGRGTPPLPTVRGGRNNPPPRGAGRPSLLYTLLNSENLTIQGETRLIQETIRFRTKMTKTKGVSRRRIVKHAESEKQDGNKIRKTFIFQLFCGIIQSLFQNGFRYHKTRSKAEESNDTNLVCQPHLLRPLMEYRTQI